jgi:hypothetical protein
LKSREIQTWEDEGTMREGGKSKMKDATSIINTTIIDAPPRADLVEQVRDELKVRNELEVLGEGGFEEAPAHAPPTPLGSTRRIFYVV